MWRNCPRVEKSSAVVEAAREERTRQPTYEDVSPATRYDSLPQAKRMKQEGEEEGVGKEPTGRRVGVIERARKEPKEESKIEKTEILYAFSVLRESIESFRWKG